jgi:PKD repeat protein
LVIAMRFRPTHRRTPRRRALHAALALGVVALLSLAVGAWAQAPAQPDSDWSWPSPTGPWGAGTTWDAPIASFTAEPPYETGREIPLRSTSTHTSGAEHLRTYEWDLDCDGAYYDATGPTTEVEYDTPGQKEIGLRVTDDKSNWSTSRTPITVAQGSGSAPEDDPAPVASFTLKGTKRVGKTLTFKSTSTGSVVTYEWDLDGDGAYDDASKPQAKKKYTTTGSRVVGLRVSDQAGNADIAQQTLTIGPKKAKKKK